MLTPPPTPIQAVSPTRSEIRGTEDKVEPGQDEPASTPTLRRPALGMRPTNTQYSTPSGLSLTPSSSKRAKVGISTPFRPPTQIKPRLSTAAARGGGARGRSPIRGASSAARGSGVKIEDDEVVFLKEERKGCRDDPIELEDGNDIDTPKSSLIPPAKTTNPTHPTYVYNITVNVNLPIDNNHLSIVLPKGLNGLSPSTPPSIAKAFEEPGPVACSISGRPRSGTDETPKLSPQQQKIFDSILKGNNVLIHGSAGTGKSVIIRAVRAAFDDRHAQLEAQKAIDAEQAHRPAPPAPPPAGAVPTEPFKLAITAPTGLAAINVTGTTLHGFVGAGLCKGPVEEIIGRLKNDVHAIKRWTSTASLIIDEISMVDGKFLDRVDAIGRALRKCSRPFGGLQMIICGAFLQLPPVADYDDEGPFPDQWTFRFAFNSSVWSRLFERRDMYNLTRNHRQADRAFQTTLERMRRGRVTTEDMTALYQLQRPVVYSDGIEPVSLLPKLKEVRAENEIRLHQLPGPDYRYLAEDHPGSVDDRVISLAEATEKLDKQTTWPRDYSLRVGAQVMLLMNMKEPYLVNGSTGVIVDFLTRSEAEKAHVPEPSLASFFSPPCDVKYPVIRFAPMAHCLQDPPPQMLIPALYIDVTNTQNKVEASRHQVPLILAWALTIHKAQGQTIERLKVDLRSIWGDGQAYTAISRARRRESLELTGVSEHKMRADPRALAWVMELEGSVDMDSPEGTYADELS